MLRLFVVTFWALFLGPEPLSCWIVIESDEYEGFQGGRVALTTASGLLALWAMCKIDTEGSHCNTRIIYSIVSKSSRSRFRGFSY